MGNMEKLTPKFSTIIFPNNFPQKPPQNFRDRNMYRKFWGNHFGDGFVWERFWGKMCSVKWWLFGTTQGARISERSWGGRAGTRAQSKLTSFVVKSNQNQYFVFCVCVRVSHLFASCAYFCCARCASVRVLPCVRLSHAFSGITLCGCTDGQAIDWHRLTQPRVRRR